ncbi:hypothetical protein GCM10009558_026070 [Virgisporangium aurantiacum]
MGQGRGQPVGRAHAVGGTHAVGRTHPVRGAHPVGRTHAIRGTHAVGRAHALGRRAHRGRSLGQTTAHAVGGTHALRRAHPVGRAHALGGAYALAGRAALEHRLATVGTHVAAPLLELGELPLHPVEVQVDLPFVISTETNPEHDIVDFLGGNRRADRVTRKCRLDPVEERVDLVDLVPTSQRPPPEPLALTRHCSSWFAPRRPVPRGGVPGRRGSAPFTVPPGPRCDTALARSQRVPQSAVTTPPPQRPTARRRRRFRAPGCRAPWW